MTFSKTPDYIRDNLCTVKGQHYYRVPSIKRNCTGCARKIDMSTPACFEQADCMDGYGDIHHILINTDEASVVRYIQARLE